MGSGQEPPKYQNYNPSQFQGGQQVLKKLLSQYGSPQGLSQETRDIFEKQGRGSLTGSLRSSEDRLGSSLSSMGNIPLSERIKGFQGLRSGYQSGLNDLYANIAGQNEQQKNVNQAQGLQGYLSLLGQSQNKEGALNQFGQQNYQIQKQNEFSPGQFFGGLAGLGSQFIPKPRAK